MRTIKKYKIALILILSLVLIPGCKDYLELEPEYSQDAENYFTKPEHYDLALIGAYDLLQRSYFDLWIGEIASDNAIAGGESLVDSKGLHEMENMSHSSDNEELLLIFQANYAGIARCNYIMENKENIDFQGKASIIAQTKFLRAFYYFQLVKYFGDVPLVIDKRLGADEVTKIKRESRNTVYSQIEQDLTEASQSLEWFAMEQGRITKGACLALLGKVYLFQDKFSLAANTFDNVISNGPYSLLADYRSLFLVSNEGHSESIFDIQYFGKQGSDYGYIVGSEGNIAAGFSGIRNFSSGSPRQPDQIYYDGNSYNLPTKDFFDAFNSNDQIRRDASILDIDAFISSRNNPSAFSYTRGAGGHTGYYNNKYTGRLSEEGEGDHDLTNSVNYSVIRLADVLLMAAEAHNRSNNDGQALIYLNQVRARVNLAPISPGGAALTDAIWAERRFELAGEGHRFFDLVRTGQAATKINGFQVGKHELFPIPQVEIDLAGGNWNQNPGY